MFKINQWEKIPWISGQVAPTTSSASCYIIGWCTSTNKFLSTGYLPRVTTTPVSPVRHTLLLKKRHLKVLFDVLTPTFDFPSFCSSYLVLLHQSLPSPAVILPSPAIQSSLLVLLLCVLAGHTEPLCSSQSWLEKLTVLAVGHLTHTQTHTHRVSTVRLKHWHADPLTSCFLNMVSPRGLQADLCQTSFVTVLLWQ